MVVVAVAGGLGDLGRLIVEALVATQKHRVIVLTRKWQSPHQGSISCVQCDYTSTEALARLLAEYAVHTVISALNVDFEEVALNQVNLILAAERTSILPYPEKHFHSLARRALEATAEGSLEYSYVHCGMFMDYMALPRIVSHRSSPTQSQPDFTGRPLYTCLDLEHGEVAIPLGPDPRGLDIQVAFVWTKDLARFVAASLDLKVGTWPRIMTVVGSSLTLGELLDLAFRIHGRMQEGGHGAALKVHFDDINDLRKHACKILPGNDGIADLFPGGRPQLQALLNDLSASMALGAYDVELKEQSPGPQSLVDLLRGQEEPPITVEDFLRKYWT